MESLFKETHYSVKLLIENVDRGQIGLPDLQRPFVWPAKKIRALFDSMYRGFPASAPPPIENSGQKVFDPQTGGYQYGVVYDLYRRLADGQWHTLGELEEIMAGRANCGDRL